MCLPIFSFENENGSNFWNTVLFNSIWSINPRNKVILRIKVFGYVTLCYWCFLFFWKNAMPESSKVDGSNPWKWRHYIMFLCNVRKYQSSNTVSYPRRPQVLKKTVVKTSGLTQYSICHISSLQIFRTEFNFLFHRNCSTFCNRGTSYPAHANLWAVDKN
jgi:hypothetical protein